MKNSVRDALIKIAFENPEIRPELLNIVKTAALSADDIAEMKEDFMGSAKRVPKFGAALKNLIAKRPDLEALNDGWDLVHQAKFTPDLKGLLTTLDIVTKIKGNGESDSQEYLMSLNHGDASVKGFLMELDHVQSTLKKHPELMSHMK